MIIQLVIPDYLIDDYGLVLSGLNKKTGESVNVYELIVRSGIRFAIDNGLDEDETVTADLSGLANGHGVRRPIKE